MSDANEEEEWNPHAFHRNLPPHHIGDDGVPYFTKLASKKAREIVKLVHSIQLQESHFVRDDNEVVETEEEEEETEDDEDGEDGDGSNEEISEDHTLVAVTKKCSRLQSRMTTLEKLKFGGITQDELCHMLLHILRLLTATVTIEYTPSGNGDRPTRRATLHYENVGYLFDGTEEHYENAKDSKQLQDELEQRFALPSPAREALLSIAVSILSKKKLLCSVSNASLYPDNDTSRKLLIFHWRALLRMLLRTAPYLDEHKTDRPPSCSNSRQATVLRRTVHLIRHARHFFDQGIRPPGYSPGESDSTSRDIWNMVKTDVLYHTHTHACYRGAIMLYLFMPTQCTPEFYLDVMPQWLESWSSIDRCPEFDYMWLVLFCRARKHVSPDQYDWGPVRKRLLTHSQYWLQIPIGGGSMDKTFPRVATPVSRACPTRLKAFVGVTSSYEEGIDFVAKVVKLLIASIGTGGVEEGSSLSQGSADVLRFLTFVAPYYNPSNVGAWTFTLGAFLHYFCYEFAERIGVAASMESIKSDNPSLASAACTAEANLSHAPIPPKELAAFLHALLPLCQQALYSKNGHVGRAGEAAMTYLAQIDPIHITPPFLDFATNALDVSAVNLSHQAPSALSALARLVQPALRRKPSILLRRLPQILQLSLAGIDSNDQNKSTRTLIFYRSLTSWVPIVSEAKYWPKATALSDDAGDDGTIRVGEDNVKDLAAVTSSDDYLKAVAALPETSILRQYDAFEYDEPGLSESLLDEACAAMGDWILAFLDRVYDLLRATGEREKTGKRAAGVARRHSSSDVQQARNFSRILKETLMQIFASMDECTRTMAVRSVVQFLEQETLPSAAKDAASLCQAVAAARDVGDGQYSSPGLDALVPVLLGNLNESSNKTVVYRLRCLSGAVRSAGHGVAVHQNEIQRAIDFALSSQDKDVFKTGCKLLRHTLSSLCGSYPISTECMLPQQMDKNFDGEYTLGKSGSLRGKRVQWHVPTKAEVEFASMLLETHVIHRINGVCLAYASEGILLNETEKEDVVMIGGDDSESEQSKPVNIMLLRRCLRVLRYSLRGSAGLLLDAIETGSDTTIPHELAVLRLLSSASEDTAKSLAKMRGLMCSFIVSLTSAVAAETVDTPQDLKVNDEASGGQRQNESSGKISSDAKVCKELSDISTMLLTRRSARIRSQELRTIWKAQKQNVTDWVLSAFVAHKISLLQRAAQASSVVAAYKDGEGGGKTLPRRLIIARLQLFYDSVERNASFGIPRRLRHLEGQAPSASKSFSTDLTLSASLSKFTAVAKTELPPALCGYEGLIDGLFSLSCHPNLQVRNAAVVVIDNCLMRFGWLFHPRVSRLLAAISLEDEDMKGNYGIPSCSQLSVQVDPHGKRTRLAEVLKGLCSILAMPRAIRDIMWTEMRRLDYVKTLCGTDKLISILPVEEMQKMVVFFQRIFNPFRSKIFSIPRSTDREQTVHENCLEFLLDILSNEVAEETTMEEGSASDSEVAKASGESHWRKRLLVAWFLTNLIDEDDMVLASEAIRSRIWKVCFDLLENETGQPLQRVAVGLLGKLICFIPPVGVTCVASIGEQVEVSWLRDQLEKESFCRLFGDALVFDHRADTSIGGGHDAQWSAGVEDIIRDSSRLVAPKTMYPFMRTSQSSRTFKIPHAQLIERVLRLAGAGHSQKCAKHLLSYATEMTTAPPSEDQRNQQCTAAEIFGGVCRALLATSSLEDKSVIWDSTLIPFLEGVVPKIPVSLASAFFDAFRYGIQSSPDGTVYPLLSWLVGKIDSSLWRPANASDSNAPGETVDESLASGADGFAVQSKWLFLASAIAIELGEEAEVTLSPPWFAKYLQEEVEDAEMSQSLPKGEDTSWALLRDKLLPMAIDAAGHPYETCRDYISGCYFRVWRCGERFALQSKANGTVIGTESEGTDPETAIIAKLTSLENASDMPFKERYNSLITTRKFISYCTHLGDAKNEFSRLVIPLLPVVFSALKATIDDASDEDEEDNAAKRALEAEVVKGFRASIVQIGSYCVMSYPGEDRDISRVLDAVEAASKHEFWQVRHAAAHFLRCFQGSHKFLFSKDHSEAMTRIVTALLADERREVSSAAMSALTGIIAATPLDTVTALVNEYGTMANRSRIKQKKKANGNVVAASTDEEVKAREEKEKKRARNQQKSVFFLCAAVLAQPYETPPYVPVALACISKHSFERSAPLGVRDTVKKACGEYKRTHMSDNWEIHRKVFTQEQLEAFEDVVSSPHYYA